MGNTLYYLVLYWIDDAGGNDEESCQQFFMPCTLGVGCHSDLLSDDELCWYPFFSATYALHYILACRIVADEEFNKPINYRTFLKFTEYGQE
jgi:hypothetical protein